MLKKYQRSVMVDPAKVHDELLLAGLTVNTVQGRGVDMDTGMATSVTVVLDQANESDDFSSQVDTAIAAAGGV